MSGDAVTLTEFCERYREALLSFSLPPEQEEFTGMPADTLDLALADPNRHPVVILAGEAPVGFFILHGWEGIGDLVDGGRALLLRAFLVDYAQQGRGYARTAMSLLPAYAERLLPGTEEIVLLVNERNIRAESLYRAAGFQDSGRRRQGTKGPQKLLRRTLGPSRGLPALHGKEE